MASDIRIGGQHYSANGVRPNIRRGVLVNNIEEVISTVTLQGTEFELPTLGEADDNRLVNTVDINFTIPSSEIGKTAAAVLWYDGLGIGLGTIIGRTDLVSTQAIDAEGVIRLSTGQARIRFVAA
jgi:hypothetical protein